MLLLYVIDLIFIPPSSVNMLYVMVCSVLLFYHGHLLLLFFFTLFLGLYLYFFLCVIIFFRNPGFVKIFFAYRLDKYYNSPLRRRLLKRTKRFSSRIISLIVFELISAPFTRKVENDVDNIKIRDIE